MRKKVKPFPRADEKQPAYLRQNPSNPAPERSPHRFFSGMVYICCAKLLSLIDKPTET